MKMLERFWEKVKIGDPDECWEWVAGKDGCGYGSFWIGSKAHRANRLAWQFTYGHIPGGMHVCHKCDNPGCANPYHLFLGTRTDNMQDSAKKGRKAKRLTSKEVLKIRELLAKGERAQQDIGDEFGVTRRTVSNIRCGETWSWLK